MQATPRNNTTLVLGTAFFISAAIDFTISGSTETISAIVEAAAGIISLAYWGLARPQNLRGNRPLGIAILAAENLFLGIILALTGVLLLFLPVIGIIGAAIAAVGIGLAYLGRGLWNGREWALTIETIVAVVQVILGICVASVPPRKSHTGNLSALVSQKTQCTGILRDAR